MRKIYISILITFGFIFHFALVNALSNSEKGAILERFQKQQYELLFQSELGTIKNEYSDIFSISKRLDLYSSMTYDVEKERLEAEQKYTELITQITSLEDGLKMLSSDIETTTNKIRQINNDVIKIKQEIDINTSTIDELKKKIDENREILLDYLIYIYKKSNTAYEGTEIDNLKSMLLNNEDIGDVINDLYFKGIIQITGQNLIDNHRSYVSELYLNKVNLEKQEEDLKQLRKQGIIEQKILQDKKYFKEKLLSESKGEQGFYEKYLEEKINLENEIKLKALRERIRLNNAKDSILDKYGCDFIDVTKNTIEVRTMQLNSARCYNINRMLYGESFLSDNQDENESYNVLTWPINPFSGITAYYLDPSYKKIFGADHNAIDLRAPQGTAIEAPMDGYVLHLKKPDSQDYSFIALKHYDGYVTVYGHLSEIMVSEYEYVEKGQVFARTGGEFGTSGAGYVTTGPHLHFEVFKDQEYIDPLSVLDLSYVKYESLPERYKLKYSVDFQNRKGYAFKDVNDKSKTFFLEGSNEIERQKYLISKYAVGEFSNWQMWIDESLDGNIDPSLTMCIGLAESGLGKNLSTPYNIGNVGNNDRGDRKGFESARQGVYSIVYTLNNRYFRDYNSLANLSGAGRELLGLPSCRENGHYCYATDTNHWHNNVARCLTHLKGTFVPDNYNFRVIK